MKLRFALRTLLVLAVALLSLGLEPSSQAASPSPSPWQDARLHVWSADYMQGKHDAVLASVERDLRSASPHLFSPHVWVVTQDSRGTLATAIAGLERDPALKAALGSLPDVYTRFQAGKYHQLLEDYPPSKTASLREYWTLTYLIWAAGERPYAKLEYEEEKLRIVPEFMGAWDYEYTANQELIGDPKVLARAHAFVTSAPVAGTPAGAFVDAQLHYDNTTVDNLAAVQEVLRVEPHETFGQRLRANIFVSGLKKYAEAATLYHQSSLAYPWADRFADEADALIRDHRRPEAERLLNDVAKRFAPTPSMSLKRRVLHDTINALMAAGERGKAKEEIDKALKESADAKSPEDAWLYAKLHQYWSYWSSPNDLAPARKAVELDPTAQHRASLVSALLNGKRDSTSDAEALAVYEQLAKEGADSLGGFVYEKLGKKDERVRWCEARLREEPTSASRRRDLAQALGDAGRKTEAVKTMLSAFEIEAPHRWDLDKIVGWLGDDTQAVDATLADLRNRYPWREDTTRIVDDRMGGTDLTARRLALYDQSKKAAPQYDWPWTRQVQLLLDAERWEDARRTAEQEGVALAASWPQQRASALLSVVWAVNQTANNHQLPAEAVNVAMARLHDLELLGGDIVTVVNYRVRLSRALGRTKELCEAATQWSSLDPDSNDAWWTLVQECSLEVNGRDRVAAKRYLDRDPDSPTRLTALANVGVKYWGAPLLTLGYVDRLKRLAPETNVSDLEGMAYGMLGDHAKDFSLRYLHQHSIADSDRYVGWYESSRTAAQEPSNVVEFNATTQTATIRYPSGEVVRRRDHPISGKIVELRRGAEVVGATYDADGINLLSLTSGELTIKLSYEKEDLMSKVSYVAGGQEFQTISFQYGPQRKPTVIAVRTPEVTGSLRISYDARGDIRKVDSEGGREVSLSVSRTFQELQDMLGQLNGRSTDPRELKSNSVRLANAYAPIRFPNFEAARMRLEVKNQNLRAEDASADQRERELAKAVRMRLAFAKYLVEHASENVKFEPDARKILRELIDDGQRDERQRDAALTAVSIWHTLLSRRGVPSSEFAEFSDVDAWVRHLASEPATASAPHAREVVRELDADPIVLLASERYLARTDYANPALWSHEPVAKLLPVDVQGAVPQAALVRENGDIVVGTNKGLLVRRGPAWAWLAFDTRLNRYSSALPAEQIDLSSDIRALAESHGTLWVGTRNGVLGLAGGYGDPPTRFGPSDGAASSEVTALTALADGAVLVGTAHGASRIDASGAHPVVGLGDVHVSAMVEGREGEVFFATSAGVFSKTRDGSSKPLASTIASSLGYDDGEDKVWAIADGKLVAVNGSLRKLGNAAHPFAIGRLSVGDRHLMTVLSDTGLWVNAEQLSVPGATDVFRSMAEGHGALVLLARDAIHIWEQHGIAFRGRVDDLLTIPELGVTFAAVEDGALLAIDDSQPEAVPRAIEVGGEVKSLARDSKGNVILGGRDGVFRLDVGTGKTSKLFDVEQTLPGDGSGYDREGPFKSVLAASDGTVWAVAGASVFRWKDGTTEEFSMFKDPVRFPARSEMISRVIETVDHRILVVASNEGHLVYKSVVLGGGLLEYTKDGFRSLGKPSAQWFISSYTPIGGSEAIIGSGSGFALHDGTRIAGVYQDLHNASYIDLVDRQNRGLFLGTRGVEVGDSWMFGTGSGVVACRRGVDHQRDRWTLLEGVNAMLPDWWLAERGGHAVHAVETDALGHLYVGTDRGLLVVGLSDAATRNNAGLFARASKEATARQSEALGDLASLSPEAASLMIAERLLAQLQTQRAAGTTVRPVTSEPDTKSELDAAQRTKLDSQIEAQKKARDAARSELEKKNPALYDLVDDSDVDVGAIQQRLGADEVLIRYLPTESGLLVDVIAHEQVTSRAVVVPMSELDARALRAAWRLNVGSAASVAGIARATVAEHDQPALDSELEWLYAQLLRPIEPLLLGKRQVSVLAHGALRYLPFGALIRSRAPRFEYAIERFTFQYVLSEPHAATSHALATTGPMVVASPELPPSDDTADPLRKLTPTLLTGDALSKANLNHALAGAGMVLLRGDLDPSNPKHDGIALAGGTSLRLFDIAKLPLSTCRLTVLAGGTSTTGKDGGDIEAMVRALSIAGTGSVLFAPGDQAGAADVIGRIRQLTEPPAAVAEVQRAAIKSGMPLSAWAGLRIFPSAQ